MKRKNLLIIFIALILILSAFAFFGCKKKSAPVFLTASGIAGFDKVAEDKALYFEWLEDYNELKPTIVVFHGETKDDYFDLDLDKDAYGEEVTYLSETQNADTIGWKAQGLKVNSDGKYDITSYWTKAAGYNVLVFHAEKFFNGTADDVITKLYTTYKNEYINGNKTVKCDLGYSLTEIMSAYLVEELKGKGDNGLEIRFVGYGTGANAALSVGYYLYKNSDNGLLNEFMPSRITLCDPYLSGRELTYKVFFDEDIANENVMSVFNYMTGYFAKKPVALEMIETEEIAEEKYEPYPNNVNSGAVYESALKNTTYLILCESYSTKECYAHYRTKNRIAFDWYMYSVIGSDDSYTYATSDQRYAIGYPNSLKSYVSSINDNSGNTNWDSNGRRPMLNNRYYTNDSSETRGREYGYNFSLSAWTPTEYIMAIKGNYFLQKKAQTILDTKDVHGRNICTYDDYVLEVFRSENYQYSELNNSTVFFGRIYFDENGDGLMNDGKNGLNAKLFVTVETNGGELLTEKTVINTDENGYYKITAYDKKSGDSGVSIKLIDGGCEIFGVESARESIIIRLQVYLPKEYNFTDVVSSKIWYNNINCNSFLKGEISPALDISEQTANSAIINNCLLIKK